MISAVASTVAGLYQLLHARWIPGVLFLVGGVLLLLPSQLASIRTEPGSERVLVFVTKPECSLCDEARALLPKLLDGTPFRVQEVALDSSRSLKRAFRNRVPVLLWQGTVIADLGWDPVATRSQLEELGRLPSVSRPRAESP